ncbi:MAG TPA: hypothetical protein VK158_01915 [Acidobacteriota bacterium]|nr:hypothetical protein [Acidobacteriota bacterium]
MKYTKKANQSLWTLAAAVLVIVLLLFSVYMIYKGWKNGSGFLSWFSDLL